VVQHTRCSFHINLAIKTHPASPGRGRQGSSVYLYRVFGSYIYPCGSSGPAAISDSQASTPLSDRGWGLLCLLLYRRWGPTYIASYTHRTGLLGLSPSWSFKIVNVVEEPVTTGPDKELSCTAFSSPPPPIPELLHRLHPTVPMLPKSRMEGLASQLHQSSNLSIWRRGIK
jgi:hypothetical protein